MKLSVNWKGDGGADSDDWRKQSQLSDNGWAFREERRKKSSNPIVLQDLFNLLVDFVITAEFN